MHNQVICVLFLAVSLSYVRAADNVSQALQKGLLEEEANQNFNAAIEQYQMVLKDFDEQRKIAATALFRIGECFRKLGKTNEALVQFQRVIHDFPDQPALVKLSQKYVADTGRPEATAVAGSTQPVLDPAQVKLLREEIALVEQQVQDVQKKFEVGQATTEDIIAAKRQLLPLQRRLPENASAARQEALIKEEIQFVQQLLIAQQRRFENGKAASSDSIPLKRDLLGLQRELLAVQDAAKPRFQTRLQSIVRRAESSEQVTADELKEIQRLQSMIQNSPDLINASQGSSTGVTPLQDAAAKGQLAVARFLLENHAGINVGAGTGGGAPLSYAAANGHKSMVELLLANGADVDSRDGGGNTPLHSAASLGFQQIAEVLLVKGADVNAPDQSGNVPLHNAVASRQTGMVELLLAHKADINAQGKSGDPALMFAVLRKDARLVELLLGHHANPNLKANDGRPPLAASLDLGTSAITELLLNKGADPNFEAGFFTTEGRAAISPAEKSTPLIYAVATKSTALVILLLQHGAEINTPDSAGRTPLQRAVRDANDALVHLLLSKGADPNIKDPEGNTALLLDLESTGPGIAAPGARVGTSPSTAERPVRRLGAVRRTILNELLAHKADVNTTGSQGFTPLLKAVRVGDTNVVDLLLAHGADVNQLTGSTPLISAIQAGDRDVASLLLAKGADPNRKGINEEGPLHVAVALEQIPMMEVLLRSDALPNLVDLLGNTPLHYAALVGNKEAAQLLLAHGAELNMVNNRGCAPAQVAVLFRREGTGAYGVPGMVSGPIPMTEAQTEVRQMLLQAAKQAQTN